MKFGVGQPMKRVEDVRFVTGAGQYSSDYWPQGALCAAFLRSPHAHAGFSFNDLETARAMPGVKAVWTLGDIAELGALPCLAPVANSDKSTTPLKPYPLLAKDIAFHVGDAIAMVVAESELHARDAVEAIGVEWSPLPAVVEADAAIAPGAPQIFDGAPSNVAYDAHIGDKAKTDAAFASATHVVTLKVVNTRVVANYLETRAAIAEYDAATDRLTLHVGTQGVHAVRAAARRILKIPSAKLRLVTQDVGGGFGTKLFLYREYPLVLEAARRLGRPVRWMADRSEHFIGDTQGRDTKTVAEMALDANGRFVAMRVDLLGNLGGYLSQFAPDIQWTGASMSTGAYDIGAFYARVRGVYTNTVPVDAYRGAGRPEAAYVLERLVDKCARELDMRREEIRARNFVKPAQMPYKTQTGRTYDVGEFEGAMRASLAKADYAGFEARADAAKK
jgi:carbon-monoxide dehydrogenase large subunit